MAWTTPRTWSAGETVTATIMNTHVRDQFNALANKAIIVSIGSAGGGVIPNGHKMYVEIPVNLRATGWTVVSDASGTIVFDIYKDSYANFPPTVGDSMTGTEKPTLSGQQKNQDLTLSSWSTDILAGDVLAVVVSNVATVQQVTLSIRCEPL